MGKREQKKTRHTGRWILLAALLLLCAGIGLLLLFRPWQAAPSDGDASLPSVQPQADAEPDPQPQTDAEPVQQSRAEPESDPQPNSPAQALLDSLTLREKVLQLFVVTPEQLTGVTSATRAGDATRLALEANPVGGLIYFDNNIQSRDQVQEMISNSQSYSRLGLLIAVDEEGGSVARVGGNSAMGTTAFPSMGSIGADGDPEQAYSVGHTIAEDLKALGFNLDFAPVADVNSNPDNPVIGKRAFSDDPAVCAEMVARCVQGFSDGGMLCTLKHFPGHGDTADDSHYGEAETTKTLAELEACEFLPFAAGIEAGAPFVMVGHITAPALTQEPLPATLSHDIVTGLLREALGFDGLIITDSMQMAAISDRYSSGEAAVRALQAGADMILMPAELEDAVTGVLDAVERGTLSEARIDESALRVLSCKLEAGIITEAQLSTALGH